MKISPKKCQIFKKELQYMENTISINEKGNCKSYENMNRDYSKIKPPITLKGCRKLCWSSILFKFFPQVTKFVWSLYMPLMRKGREIHWGDRQQEAVEEIKRWLQKPPGLYMPYNKEDFIFILIQIGFNMYCTLQNSKWATEANCKCKQKNAFSSSELLHNRISIICIGY